MRIKTRLQISVGVSIVVAVVMALIFVGQIQRVNEASKKGGIVENIVKGLFELNILTFDYLQHPEERARAQWLLKHDTMAALLASNEFQDPEEVAILNRIRQIHEDIKAIFSRLSIDQAVQEGAEQPNEISQELKERLAGQLAVKSQTIFSGAFQLAALNRADIVAAQQSAILLATIFIAILITIMGSMAFLANKSIIKPIATLTQIADDISKGNLKNQIEDLDRRDEIGILARGFKQMTGYLIEANTELEQRVASRTWHLEIVASLGERLSAILNLEVLLVEVVNQIKDNFGYYHAHIYLLDDKGEKLVVAEGTGAAGVEMKSKGHYISLNAPTSLVAGAARSGQIMKVDNVHERADWLPNPLLPDTYSEMAVPIILEGKVVGILDVQQDKIAGLDEGDASLLRSLANQVAVAIRNARQFAEVEAALVEARELQRRYLVQSWDRSRVTRKSVGRVQFSLGESTTLGEGIIASAQQQALSHQKSAVVVLNGQQDDTVQHALVAPITLRDVVIGDLQLHEIGPDREWTESELALINAVVDQVAQIAENLRLFDETQERASREQLVSQISNKMRRAPDMESLMQVAVAELSRVLNPARTFVRLGPVTESRHDQGDGVKEAEAVEPVYRDDD